MFKNIQFKNNQLKSIFIFIIFILGLYYVINQPIIETFEKNTSVRCPNLLIQRGSTLYLSNTKLANVPGVNPIKFNNLDEYVEFSKWQRSQGIRCPILHLEEEYDAQNNRGYSVRPDPWAASKNTSKSKYYPSNAEKVPADPKSMPGFDPQNQDIGKHNKIDAEFYSDDSRTANTMVPQWGGVDYSEKQVAEGDYVGSYVYKRSS